MKWRQPASRSVVEAVIGAFREPSTFVHGRLAQLSLRQWEQSYYWLDASGLALYLLARIESLDMVDAIPARVLTRLRQNSADNRRRVASMLAEFTELNQFFSEAGLTYCNLKGFTLAPDSCPNLELRCQLDFDFLLDGKDIHRCREILEQRGYIVRGQGNNVLEFKTDTADLARITDLYKPKPQRSVEIHFATNNAGKPTCDPRLGRLRTLPVHNLNVPALSAADQFIGQATHLFGHLCGAHTRVAWLLEFAHHMRARADDQQFWSDVRERATSSPSAAIALGVATMLSMELFTLEPLPVAARWMLDRIPEGITCWTQRYGRVAILADSPGTKLGLLLKNEAHRNDIAWQKQKRNALLPLHRAPRLLHVGREESLLKHLRAELYQLRYVLFRLRFHLVEGLHYLRESARFRRLLTQHSKAPLPEATFAQLHKSRP